MSPFKILKKGPDRQFINSVYEKPESSWSQMQNYKHLDLESPLQYVYNGDRHVPELWPCPEEDGTLFMKNQMKMWLIYIPPFLKLEPEQDLPQTEKKENNH